MKIDELALYGKCECGADLDEGQAQCYDCEEADAATHCMANARRGTGTGMCGRPVDGHGYCDRASDHIDI